MLRGTSIGGARVLLRALHPTYTANTTMIEDSEQKGPPATNVTRFTSKFKFNPKNKAKGSVCILPSTYLDASIRKFLCANPFSGLRARDRQGIRVSLASHTCTFLANQLQRRPRLKQTLACSSLTYDSAPSHNTQPKLRGPQLCSTLDQLCTCFPFRKRQMSPP